MKVIDKDLGGTTLLDVTLDFDDEVKLQSEQIIEENEFDDIFEEFDQYHSEERTKQSSHPSQNCHQHNLP